MHQLHLVGFTADHDGLIFSTKKGASSGAYVVGVDDALFAALEQARRMAMAEPDDMAARAAAERVRALRPAQRSNLSVRDIQSRLRSGMTLGQVAAEAGVDEDWVARFAAPVAAEQAAIVERALAFTFTTARKGASSRPLGEAVRWNLLDKGISVDTSAQAAGWSAFQLEPGQWAIRFTYTSRGRTQVAEWEIDLDAGELSGRNRLANELAYVEPGARRRKPAEGVAPPAPPAPKKATTGRKGTPARTTTARAQAARATSSKAAANRAKAAKPAPSERGKQATGPAARGRQASGAAERGKQATGPAERGRQPSGRGGGGGASGARAPEAVGETRRFNSPGARSPGRAGVPPDPGPSARLPVPGLARFSAPRPAAGRPEKAAPTNPPDRPRSSPAARAVEPRPVPRPSRPAPRSASPAPEPALRRVAPPSRPAPGPTADARPMPTTLGPDRPSRADDAEPGRPGRPERPEPAVAAPEPPARPTPVVRRLPSPAPAAASPRAEQESAAPSLRPVPDLPTPEPEPPPDPPRPAPATVRPVGGGDGRPTILIIDADRAGDRRRS